MAEKAFGLSVNEVMAYAAVANVLLVVVLAAVNIYYAGHSKRQADASRDQVATSHRQAEIAAETLSILRKQIDQQRAADRGTVSLQLKVAIHTIEDWLKRIGSDAYPQLPDEIRILPADFSVATQRANAIDQIVAENMGAASLYAGEAETNLNILRTCNPAQPQGWKEMQEKATKNLNIAKYKLNVARTRWEATDAPPGTV
jgi:cell division protein FtsL